MTLEEAFEKKKRYDYLVGQKEGENLFEIEFLVVAPSDNYINFINTYRDIKDKNDTSNWLLLITNPSTADYTVALSFKDLSATFNKEDTLYILLDSFLAEYNFE